ncbi:MAG: type I-E CRISPR-associated protein Cas6/Cse3/CasE [Halorhodospira sp.]
MQVEDPEAFAYGLEHGIGRGKAFGLGMLTVAPLTRTEGL